MLQGALKHRWSDLVLKQSGLTEQRTVERSWLMCNTHRKFRLISCPAKACLPDNACRKQPRSAASPKLERGAAGSSVPPSRSQGPGGMVY